MGGRKRCGVSENRQIPREDNMPASWPCDCIKLSPVKPESVLLRSYCARTAQLPWYLPAFPCSVLALRCAFTKSSHDTCISVPVHTLLYSYPLISRWVLSFLGGHALYTGSSRGREVKALGWVGRWAHTPYLIATHGACIPPHPVTPSSHLQD